MAHTPGEDDIPNRLRALRDAYVYKINYWIEQGREDLARELADACTEEALQLMSTQAAEDRG